MLKVYYIRYGFKGEIHDHLISATSPKEAVQSLVEGYEVPKDTIISVYEYVNKEQWD